MNLQDGKIIAISYSGDESEVVSVKERAAGIPVQFHKSWIVGEAQ